jgi:hypothetical protein
MVVFFHRSTLNARAVDDADSAVRWSRGVGPRLRTPNYNEPQGGPKLLRATLAWSASAAGARRRRRGTLSGWSRPQTSSRTGKALPPEPPDVQASLYDVLLRQLALDLDGIRKRR